MTAYYNEIDPYVAQWLRNLIRGGHIAPGDIDQRSIEDVRPNDLRGYDQHHFFAGIGVWSYALRRAGWPDDRSVWTGSCPCQPFSAAGEGAGFDDERHLWPAMHHLLLEHKKWCEQQKRRIPTVFGEQVASKGVGVWIDLVQSDLEAMDYSFGVVPFPAASVRATHVRDRTYWCADPMRKGREGHQPIQFISGGERAAFAQFGDAAADVRRALAGDFQCLLPSYEPSVGVERSRTKAYGNAIYADAAQIFIEAVMETTTPLEPIL